MLKRSEQDKDPLLREAYALCRKIALGHYENFPVGSILLPAEVRPHFFALYAFMRTADDIADLPGEPTVKLQKLEAWRTQLKASFDPGIQSADLQPIFRALKQTAKVNGLTIRPLDRLLNAFTFDARGDVRFETLDDLLYYCSNSANPVGELVLALFGYRDAERIRLSDSICSGLQLLNFCQDLTEDLENQRLYLPLDALRTLGIVSIEDMRSPELARLAVLHQLDEVERLIAVGSPLTEMVRGRLKYELRAVVHAARAMIQKIRAQGGNTLRTRPKLSKLEHLAILVKSLFVAVT